MVDKNLERIRAANWGRERKYIQNDNNALIVKLDEQVMQVGIVFIQKLYKKHDKYYQRHLTVFSKSFIIEAVMIGGGFYGT